MPAPVATRARLRPGLTSVVSLTPLPRERVAFHASGIACTVGTPVARAAIRAVLPLADREVVLVSFAADTDAAGRLDMAAIVGWDGAALRLLGLEVLAWRADASGPLAARLTTRIAATADRTRLLLARDAFAPRGPLTMRRESWTDFLAWRDGSALADAPARASLPGTWQNRLADTRTQMIARLARPCDTVSDDVLALCLPPDLGLR